jgi:S1-C subfamily serine protease
MLENLAVFLVLIWPVAFEGVQQTPPPAAGGVQASGPTFRVVRSVSGSKGSTQGGRFIIDDPRTIFYLPQDKQVVIYFEWEGPTGPHKFEGYWKNPEGKTTVITDFSYEAKAKRFGGYWTLTLSEAMQTGIWMLEARVDGEITGTYTFQILTAEKPADAVPARRPLPPAEVYKRAVAASVFIEKIDPKGEKAATGSGFFLGENILATAFQVIDGASALRIRLPDGRRIADATVVGWNRRQDWAVLEVNAGQTATLDRAKKDSLSVGDRCFTLDSPSEGSRVIVDADVIGIQEFPGAGERLSISAAPSRAAIGGPLLDEYGDVIGIVGGSLLPGASSLESMRFGYAANVLSLSGLMRGVLGVPIHLVALSPPQRGTLADLARGGQFVPLLTAQRNVMSGTLSKQLDRKSGFPQPLQESNEFSRRDQQFFVYVGWEPKEKFKPMATVRVYDLDNHLVAQTLPSKLSLETGKIVFTDVRIPIASLAPGMYRIDLLTDGEVAWRSFFRIVE